MKKRIYVLIGIQFLFLSLQAQKIKYESSFEAARQIAFQHQKPIAILITIQPPVPSSDFMKGLDDEMVIEKFNNNFINYKVAREDTANAQKIIRTFKISRFPSYVFLDSKGGLMLTDIAFLFKASALLEIADKGMAATKERSLVDFDNDYKNGNTGTSFLRSYILRRENTGISSNAELIEKYVDGLGPTDLNNYDEVLFILKAGPLADSRAYRLAISNNKIIKNIFINEPLPDRIAMNNATITNTLNSAIENKNLARAYSAAAFTRSTWTNDYEEGQKNWNLKMLQYYFGVKDTANYLRIAAPFYDQYYMQLTTDSIERRDSFNYQLAKKFAAEKATANSNDTSKTRSFGFAVPRNSYATELNNIAWNFYEMAGSNNDYVFKAVMWSQRSIELNPRSAYYDTYAHLLYKLKRYDEAENTQRKAIETAKSERAETKIYEEEYGKMKKRIL